MPIPLLPLPALRKIAPPVFDPSANPDVQKLAEEMLRWSERFMDDYAEAYTVMMQNTARLSRLSIPPVREEEGPSVGHGLAHDTLRGIPWNMASARYASGLQLADGADRGKITITFSYLGVGPVILGDGTTTTLTADLAVSGVNGLDTGAEAANTWYAVHVISSDEGIPVSTPSGTVTQPPVLRQSARVACLLSTSATAPLLPAGFSRFRRVGWARNNGASDLYRVVNAADSDFFEWNENITGSDFLKLNVTTSAVTFTDVVCSTAAPPTCRELLLSVWVYDTVLGNVHIKNKDAGNVAYDIAMSGIGNSASEEAMGRQVIGCDSAQTIQYRTRATTNDAQIGVLGYFDRR